MPADTHLSGYPLDYDIVIKMLQILVSLSVVNVNVSSRIVIWTPCVTNCYKKGEYWSRLNTNILCFPPVDHDLQCWYIGMCEQFWYWSYYDNTSLWPCDTPDPEHWCLVSCSVVPASSHHFNSHTSTLGMWPFRKILLNQYIAISYFQSYWKFLPDE